MKKKIIGVWILISCFILIGCTNEEDYTDFNIEANAEMMQLLSEDSIMLENDSIIEIPRDSTLTKPPKIKTYSSYDKYETGLDGAINMPVNLIIKQNPFGSKYITYKGDNKECKLENASNGRNQQFFLRRMPLTGQYYFAPYENPNAILSSGIYTSKPDVNILYVKTSTSSFGAVWDIYKGDADDFSFVMENSDLLEQGNGGWWDVYSLSLGVNVQNGNLAFSKYRSLRTQQFEIRPCDDFVVEEMTLSQNGTSIITDIPDFVITDTYSNDGSSTQTMSTKIVKKAQKTSSWNRKTSLTTNVSTSIKVGAFFAESKIDISVGTGQEWSYGGGETHADEREYNFPLVIAPYKRVEVSIMVARKQATIHYKAKLRGIETGTIITEEGTWDNVDCTNIVVDLKEYDTRTGQLTGTRKIQGIPTSATGVR